MAMIINCLPIELVLKTMSMLTDIRDINALINSNQDIKHIIINNFTYIIKNLISNNKISYPQMSIIISCCYNNNLKIIDYKYNELIIYKLCEFINQVPKNEIISDAYALVFNNLVNTQYQIYYYCRIYEKLTHSESHNAALILDWKEIDKMCIYLSLQCRPMDAIYAAKLIDEEVIKMNMIMENKIDMFNSIRAVNELSDDGIIKMLKLVKRGIPPVNAIDAIVDLEDEDIEIMCQLINEGIEPDVARYSSVYTEEHRHIMLYLFHKNINIDVIIDIIENNFDDRINWFVTMIDNNIDIEFASNIINDENIDNEKFNEFINLIKMNVEYKLARTIIENFDDIKIIKFITIINLGVSIEVAYDVVDLFNNTQITEFLKLINNGIEANTAYDIVILYNDNQRMMCSILIKNNISCELVESYNDEQISTFIRIVNEDNVDFNTAKCFIDSMEPSAKRRH